MGNITLDSKTRAPLWWIRLSRGIRFFIISLIGIFSTTAMYSVDIRMKVIFWFSIAAIAIQTFDIFAGTKEVVNDDTIEIPDMPQTQTPTDPNSAELKID